MEIIIAVIALGIIIFVGYSMLNKEVSEGKHPLDSLKITTEFPDPKPEIKEAPVAETKIEEPKVAVQEKIEAKTEVAPSKPKKKYYHNKPKGDNTKKPSAPKKPAPTKAPKKPSK
jgi:FtsZ-interacting cell division protein ZipA